MIFSFQFDSAVGAWFDGSRGKRLCGSVSVIDNQMRKGREILWLFPLNFQLFNLFCNSTDLVDVVGGLLGVVTIRQQ